MTPPFYLVDAASPDSQRPSRTLSGRSRADPGGAKTRRQLNLVVLHGLSSKRQLRPSGRSGREDRSQDLTGFDLKSIDQGFRLVDRGAKRSHRWMLRILNRASISRPLTLKRCAPALAVRQAWPKGGAGARWSAASRRTMAQTAFAWPDQTSYSSSNATYQVNSRY